MLVSEMQAFHYAEKAAILKMSTQVRNRKQLTFSRFEDMIACQLTTRTHVDGGEQGKDVRRERGRQ